MRRGNASPGATSRLGTETDPLPPGVTSCACTASITPRMRFWLELRNERTACTSSTYAPPRGVALVSPQSDDTAVTGESAGKSIFRPGRLCRRSAMAASARMKILLRIHTRNRHLPRILIHVMRAGRALRAYRNRHQLGRILRDAQRYRRSCAVRSRPRMLQSPRPAHRTSPLPPMPDRTASPG